MAAMSTLILVLCPCVVIAGGLLLLALRFLRHVAQAVVDEHADVARREG